MSDAKFKRTLPLVKWPGGKSRMLKTLMPIISDIPHNCYVEPFFGGGAVMFAKQPAKHEVINDINGDLINLYRQVQAHPDALIRELRLLQNSRHTFCQFRLQYMQRFTTEIQRAAQYLYCNWFSFGGQGSSYAVARTNGISKRNLMKKIARISRRLDKVAIENLDWERCITLYDYPEALFFIDPPYTAGQTSSYDMWTVDDLTHLHDVLKSVKGNWIVTMNDCPAAREIFSLHPFLEVETKFSLAKNTGANRAKKSELIITKLPFS